MKAYHIKQWDTLYETAETRKIRALSYYAKPNKLVGEGIGLTLAQEDNVALLGTWALIEALASTAPREYRGWLVRNGTALTPARMAALTRVEAKHFERALEFFCQPEVAWLEEVEFPGDSPGEMPKNPKSGAGREAAGTISPREIEEGMDQRETGERALAGAAPTVEEVRAWAIEDKVEPDFAEEKHRQHTTRGGWTVRGRLIDWKARWLDYWHQEAEAWLDRRKKSMRAVNRHQLGWQEGDDDFWWTGELALVEAAAAGAWIGGDKKNAARIDAVIALRKGRR